MRLLALLLVAGCVDHDLCAGHDGACIGLTVHGQGSVDQLRIRLSGSARLDGLTPDPPGEAHALPVSTALFLPPVGGAVDILVIGFRGDSYLGEGTATAIIRPGLHQNVDVTLVLPRVDLAGGADLAAADLAAPDLAVEPDLQADLTVPDLTQEDLSGPPPRYVFLLPARSSALGPHGDLDALCESTAASGGLPPTAYRAIIAYPPSDSPDSYLSLTEHRNIIKPDGTKVATDDTFFSSTLDHLAAIDQLADMTPVSAGCVYTNFSRTGFRINSPSDCNGWSDATSGFAGTTGDVKASDSHWSFQTPILSCDQLSCHVYCMQQ